MPPRTQESAIYTGPETGRSTMPPPGSAHLLPAVEIVPAPPLRPKSMERRWAIVGFVVCFALGIGVGIGIGVLVS